MTAPFEAMEPPTGNRPFRAQTRPAERHALSRLMSCDDEEGARGFLVDALESADAEGKVWTPLLDGLAASGRWPLEEKLPSPEARVRSMRGWVAHQEAGELTDLLIAFEGRAIARLVATRAHDLDDRLVGRLCGRPGLLWDLASNPNLPDEHVPAVFEHALTRLSPEAAVERRWDGGEGPGSSLEDAALALRTLLQSGRTLPSGAVDAVVDGVLHGLSAPGVDTREVLPAVTGADADQLTPHQLMRVHGEVASDTRAVSYLLRELGRRPAQLARWLEDPVTAPLHVAIVRFAGLHDLLEEPAIRRAVRTGPDLRALQFFARLARPSDMDELVENLLDHIRVDGEGAHRARRLLAYDLEAQLKARHLRALAPQVADNSSRLIELTAHPSADPGVWLAILEAGSGDEVESAVAERDAALEAPGVRARLGRSTNPWVLRHLLSDATGDELRRVFARLARHAPHEAFGALTRRLSDAQVSSLGPEALTPLLSADDPALREAALAALPDVDPDPEGPCERRRVEREGRGRRGSL